MNDKLEAMLERAQTALASPVPSVYTPSDTIRLAEDLLELLARDKEREERFDVLEAVAARATAVSTVARPRARDGGGFELPFKDATGMADFLFEAAAALLQGSKLGGVYAHNYVAVQGTSPVGRLELTVQRVGKVTPHEARRAAEMSLERAVAMLAQHGIPWTDPTTFRPDKPEPAGAEVPDGPVPWRCIDLLCEPCVLRCRRCNGIQSLPASATPAVARAITQAFEGEHTNCQVADSKGSAT